MSLLGILALGVVSDENTRLVSCILLALAVVFLLAGAILALVAWRNQRKGGVEMPMLEPLENEAS